jgi:hypothetical protein
MNHEVTGTRVNTLVDVLVGQRFRPVRCGTARRAREANVNRELPTTSTHPASTSYGPTVVVPYASRVNVPAAMHAMLLRNWAMALPYWLAPGMPALVGMPSAGAEAERLAQRPQRTRRACEHDDGEDDDGDAA